MSDSCATSAGPHVEVKELTVGYGERVIQQDVSFTVRRSEIFVIMGGSGCGKSTLMRAMIGLLEPMKGDVCISGENLWDARPERRRRILRHVGVLFQGGALWSSMTLGENVALPLQEYTRLDPEEVRDIVALKLALVGLAGFEDYFPAELSGGMRKRAGLARAMALDPDILFFDEPSSGLDPISAKLLDDLILELRDGLGSTVVMVTHELPSILGIGDNSIVLDAESKSMIAAGPPRELLESSPDPRVRRFLTRGKG